jgi:hypothetical protein
MAQTPVPQGNLNRLLASVTVLGNSALNVISGYLAPEAIRLSFDDMATDLLPTMTGMVSSPKPYQGVTVTVALVKSTPLAVTYQRQFAISTLLGDATVIPDAANMDPYPLHNMTLETIREMNLGGTEAAMVVTLRGYREVNAGFFG